METREVHTATSPYHEIHVEDHGMLRVLRFDRNRQSTMYLDAPFDTDFEYPAYLHTPLAIKPSASRAVMIGLGGGTVPKRYWRDYPWMRIDVIELDPTIVEVASRFFALPDDERLRVFSGDGRAFVESSAETYDIAIVDAFDEDRVPRPLTTEEFMRALRDRIAADGAAAYNFIGNLKGERSKPFRSLYRTMTNVWRNVFVFEVDGSGGVEGSNIILLATDAEITARELRARIADRVGGIVTVPAFQLIGADLFTGAVRTGDAPIIVDPPRFRR